MVFKIFLCLFPSYSVLCSQRVTHTSCFRGLSLDDWSCSIHRCRELGVPRTFAVRVAHSLWDQFCDAISLLAFPGDRMWLGLGLTSSPSYTLINFWKNFLNKSPTQSDKYFEEKSLAVTQRTEGWLKLHENKTSPLNIELSIIFWHRNTLRRVGSLRSQQKHHPKHQLKSWWSGNLLSYKIVHSFLYVCKCYKIPAMSPNQPPLGLPIVPSSAL